MLRKPVGSRSQHREFSSEDLGTKTIAGVEAQLRDMHIIRRRRREWPTAALMGVNEGTLGNWVNLDRRRPISQRRAPRTMRPSGEVYHNVAIVGRNPPRRVLRQ